MEGPAGGHTFSQQLHAQHACGRRLFNCLISRCCWHPLSPPCRAVRAIEAGEEVTTAYAELAAPRWERRQALLRHHLFDIDAAMLTDSAAEAAGAAASGLQGGASQRNSQPAATTQAALQCLPQQGPAATLPLVEGAGELRLYACQLPPWPHDAADPALTAIVLAAAAAGAGCGASSGWGGMWGSLQQADSSATAASQSFGVDELLEAAAGAVPGASGSSGARGPASAGGAAAQQQQHQQQQQRPLFHCWSPAVEEQQQLAAIEQLAQRYAAALQLQQSLDGLLAGGRASAAVQQLALVLQALSGLPPASSAGGGSASLALGPRHILRMRLLADLHRAAVAAEQWEAALKAAHQLLPLYQQAYQPVGGGMGECLLGVCPITCRELHPSVPWLSSLLQQWNATSLCPLPSSCCPLPAALCLLPSACGPLPAALCLLQVWPPVGLLWASIAKLEHLREAPAKVLAAAEQALRILAATHGSGGAVVEQMRRVQLEARQEMRHRQLAALDASAAAEADD